MFSEHFDSIIVIRGEPTDPNGLPTNPGSILRNGQQLNSLTNEHRRYAIEAFKTLCHNPELTFWALRNGTFTRITSPDEVAWDRR